MYFAQVCPGAISAPYPPNVSPGKRHSGFGLCAPPWCDSAQVLLHERGKVVLGVPVSDAVCFIELLAAISVAVAEWRHAMARRIKGANAKRGMSFVSVPSRASASDVLTANGGEKSFRYTFKLFAWVFIPAFASTGYTSFSP